MRNWLWIALGGGLGAVARYGVASMWPSTLIPYSIFSINVSGSFLIGIVLTLAIEYGWLGERGRLFVAVGLLGGYTTFSTYMLGVHQLFTGGTPWAALGYALGSLVAGLVACWVGMLGTRRFVQVRRKVDSLSGEQGSDEPEGV